MKRKKKIVILSIAIGLIIAGIAFFGTMPKWSEKTFEAIVQETVTMVDGEIRLLVQRTTEIYADPLNSLGISEETKIINADGKTITVQDLQPGDQVEVVLKDAFTEAPPFYYPTVYEIKIMEAMP